MINSNNTINYAKDSLNGFVPYDFRSIQWPEIDRYYLRGQVRMNSTVRIERILITGIGNIPQNNTMIRKPRFQIEAEAIFGKMRLLTDEENRAKKEMIIAISEPTGINFFDETI